MLVLRNYIYKQFFFLKKDKKLYRFYIGDLIKVSISEKEKKTSKRKSFIGICIFKKKFNLGLKIILKKIIKSNYIEKSFLLYSPLILSIEVLKNSRNRK